MYIMIAIQTGNICHIWVIQVSIVELGPSKISKQWRIYIVKFWTRPPPPGGPNSFNFVQFLGKFGKIVCWRPPGELAPPPRGNPGSATAKYRYLRTGINTFSGVHNIIIPLEERSRVLLLSMFFHWLFLWNILRY